VRREERLDVAVAREQIRGPAGQRYRREPAEGAGLGQELVETRAF
jgi:hypothetical protein